MKVFGRLFKVFGGLFAVISRPLLIVFLLCVIPFGLALVFIVPPGDVPDEPAHFVRAVALGQGQWIGHRGPRPGDDAPQSAGYEVDSGLLPAVLASSEPGGVTTPELAERRKQVQWSHQDTFVDVPNTAVYPPVFYIPGSIAVDIARVAGLGPFDSLQTVRIANFFCYLVLALFAIGLARRMRTLLFGLLALPACIALAASASQDGLLIGTSALAAALFTRADTASRTWAVVALSMVCMAKPPYMPLLGLLAWPADARAWRDTRGGLTLMALGALPALIWVLLAAAVASVPFARAPYSPGPLYSGTQLMFSATDPIAQLQVLLLHPLHLLTLPLGLRRELPLQIGEIVGVLGQRRIVLPMAIYLGWALALGWAFACETLREKVEPYGWRKIIAVVVSMIITVYAVCLTEYITWTDVGATAIAGVQGRYWLPVVFLVTTAIPVITLRRWKLPPYSGLAVIVPMCIVQTIVVPIVLIKVFYAG